MADKKQMPGGNGIILIDKPLGWSSYDVIRFLKRKFAYDRNSLSLVQGESREDDFAKGKIKIGHAGTLDPMATGLLIILLGSAAKKFAEFQKLPKEYIATLEFGKETDTYDATGKIVREYAGAIEINKRKLEAVLGKFRGEITQMPPAHSALKIGGKPAYELARAGNPPELRPRKVAVYEAKILKIDGGNMLLRRASRHTAEILFSVSSGTYIRSLANDIGRGLGYGAHLSGLRRTKIGNFSVAQAKAPEELFQEI